MLYLAEVQKKSSFIGSGKAEFKLLACQRSEQSWSAVPGDETIPAPDDATYGAGALVMVDLSGTRQVQRHSEAGRQLVSILQSFSGSVKKLKTQEEEIEQWKQSLTFQSQELNRRELDMETRREQLEEAEADLEKLENQKQELEASQAELTKLQEDFERKTQELEGAWAHLNGEMRRLEERQGELQHQAGLDEAQVLQIQDALNRLTGATAPTESVREQINQSFALLDQQQSTLDQHWQGLESRRGEAGDQQQQVEQQAQTLQERWQAWHESEATLVDKRADIKGQQATLSARRDQVRVLSEQLQHQSALHKQVYALLNPSDQVRLGKKVDVAALEAMPLEALQETVADLEKELDKLSRFVNDQEEELALQQQAIDEIKGKIEQASEFDRLQLETDLADEQESYKFLNETLVGQRRSLLEREEVLSQHRAVMLRRQGLSPEDDATAAINLDPVIDQIDSLRQELEQAIATLEEEIKQLESSIEALNKDIEQTAQTQASQGDELKQLEQDLQNQRQAMAEAQAQVSLYETMLQPSQDSLTGLRQKLEEMAQMVAQFQEASDYQLQAIADMRQTVLSVAGQSPELAAS